MFLLLSVSYVQEKRISPHLKIVTGEKIKKTEIAILLESMSSLNLCLKNA